MIYRSLTTFFMVSNPSFVSHEFKETARAMNEADVRIFFTQFLTG